MLAVTLAIGMAATLRAEDWPQILGPHRNNTTSEVVKPWKTPPREVWRAAIGEGGSAPIISGGRVFVHAKVTDKEEEELVVLDEASGKILSRNGYARRPYSSNTGNGPRTTPACSLDKVFTFGVTGGGAHEGDGPRALGGGLEARHDREHQVSDSRATPGVTRR